MSDNPKKSSLLGCIDEIKRAYRKQALSCHPDKVRLENCQNISLYSVLRESPKALVK